MSKFFTFKEVKFWYSDQDKGPAVLFLHGHLENSGMWKEIAASLPKSTRKICLDLPGHGHSGNLGYVHSMEEMAEVVEALLEHLKLKKVLLCGHSMGGYVALAFAEAFPDKVRGLILMNSTARADNPEKKKNRDKAIAVAKKNHRSFIRHAIPMLFRPKHRRLMKDTVNEVKKEALRTSKQGAIAAIEGMKIRPDREVLLHFAPYRVLFIAGKNDPVIPFEFSEEQMKAAQVTGLVTENGHMGYLEDADVVIPAVKKFVRECV